MSGVPYVVAATIHGPANWTDVIDSTTGVTVAVCPQARDARRIATLLTEHQFCDVKPAPVSRRKRFAREVRA